MTAFSLGTLGFLYNLDYSSQYTDIGVEDIDRAIANDDQDYSEIINEISELIGAVQVTDIPFDLTKIFTVKCDNVKGSFSPVAVYGGSVKANTEGTELAITFGKGNEYPVIQNEKNLTCGSLTGDIEIHEIKDESGKLIRTNLVWSANIADEVFLDLPIILKKLDESGNEIVIDKKFFAKHIKSNNLLAYAQPIGTGSMAIKARDIGVGDYDIASINYGERTNVAKGETFFYADLHLADGRVAAANSKALAKIKALAEDKKDLQCPVTWCVRVAPNGMSSYFKIDGEVNQAAPKKSGLGDRLKGVKPVVAAKPAATLLTDNQEELDF